MTAPGLRKVLTTERPRILVIEEIDDASTDAQAALLPLMSDALVAPAIHGATTVDRVEVRVIATANDAQRLLPALRDRFTDLPMGDYSPEERRSVIEGFLIERDGMDPSEAAEIAGLIAPVSASVRDAERLADARREDPELGKQMAERLRLRRLEQPAARRTRRR